MPSGLGGGREAGREVPWWVRGLSSLACGVGGRGSQTGRGPQRVEEPDSEGCGGHIAEWRAERGESARVGLRPPEQARSRRPAGEAPCQSMCDVSHNRKCLWWPLGPRPAVKATFPIGHAENPSTGGRQSPCTWALGVCGSQLPRCGVCMASEHCWARPSQEACLASPVLPSFLSPLPPCLPGPGSLQWSPAGSRREPPPLALYARLC